jgi:2'-5' RNA ligase
MAFLGLRVPHEVARLLEVLDVPGQKLSASDMHITILYLGKNVPITELARVMVVAYSVICQQQSFVIGIESIASFAANPDDGFPIICPVESPELHQLHDSLITAFIANDINFSNKWPEYKPHITLAYHKPEPIQPEFQFSSNLPAPLIFTSHELMLWGGDEGDGRIYIGLPFVLSPLERIAAKISDME